MAAGEFVHDGEADAGPDLAARLVTGGVEPLEDPFAVRDGDARSVVVDPHEDVAVVARRRPTTTDVVAYFSAFSTRLATIWASRSGSASAVTPDPSASTSRTPHSPAAGAKPCTVRSTISRDVETPRVERELVRVEPGEVEQVGDEPFEAARFGGDHPRGAARSAVDSMTPSAIASGVALDRGERRAEIVRDAQEEGPFVAACRLELVGHGVDAPRQRGELVVGARDGADAGREVALRDAVGGCLHGVDRPREAPRQQRRRHRGDQERDRAGGDQVRAGATERSGLDVLGEDEHGRDVVDRRERLGDEGGAVGHAALRRPVEQRAWVEIVGGQPPGSSMISLRFVPQAAPRRSSRSPTRSC